MTKNVTLAIDIGGTNTKLGLVDDDLRVVEEIVVPTLSQVGAEKATENWLKTISIWKKNYNIEVIGIGSPGPLDGDAGTLLETPNIKGWGHFSLTQFFSKELGAPCFLENDANCAALGEWSQAKVSDLVMITLGTGVGTGVISSNKLVRGVKGLGVEAGHMTINFDGPLCGCGKKGCFEAYVGGRLLVEHYNSKSSKKIQDLDAQEVFNRAKSGDAVAGNLVEQWVFALAVGIGNLVNIFNPTLVTVTGGLSQGFVQHQRAFEKNLLSQAFDSSLKCSKVVVSRLQEKAGLLGAALWARQQQTSKF